MRVWIGTNPLHLQLKIIDCTQFVRKPVVLIFTIAGVEELQHSWLLVKLVPGVADFAQ